MEAIRAGRSHVSRLEFVIVLMIAAVFLGINLATCTRFPVVWEDEVYYSEPAVNANLGIGFTSYANSVQPHGPFWVGNPPLYPMLLTGWLRLFGIGIVQTRSFGYVLAALAIVVIWWAVARLALITSALMRIGFLLTLLLAYGPGICYRSSRYDTLGILLVALTLLAASVARVRLRLALIVGVGALFTMTQLTLVIFAAEIGVLLLCVYGRRYLREVMALGIGTILGGALLFLLLQSQAVWPYLVAMIHHQRTLRLGWFPKDPSFLLILTAACCLALDQYRRGDFRFRSPLIFGVMAGVVVSLGHLAMGWYPTYYTWMAILPLSVGIFAEFSCSGRFVGALGRSMAVAALCLSAFLGMPLQLASAVRFWQERDYNRVIALVQANVDKEDWVYCDPGAYYPAKLASGAVFLMTYDKDDRFFTPDEKQRISVMIIPPYAFDRVSKRLGGAWVPTGEWIRPPDGGFLFFRVNFGDKLVWNYNLQAYRRAGRDIKGRAAVGSEGN